MNASIEKRFKHSYPNWDEMAGDGFTDGANVVAIYPEENGHLIGINMKEFDQEDVTFLLGKYSKEEIGGTTEFHNVYRADCGETVSFFGKHLIDPFLYTVGATHDNLVMTDRGDVFPIKVEIPDSDWNGVVAPRKCSEGEWIQHK